MSRAVEGLKNEALRAALRSAAANPTSMAMGRPYDTLAQLLAKSGGLPGLRPNLTLAAAFGVEVAQLSDRHLTRLLDQLASEDAAPDDPRAFLPVAAAHGYAQCLLSEASPVDAESGWRGLQLLAADERAPVRMGACAALTGFAAHDGNVDVLIERAGGWLADEDRELSHGAVASAIEVLTETRLLGSIRDYAALLAFLTSVFTTLAEARRSASRSAGRRRVLRALPNMLASLVATSRAAAAGSGDWFRQTCEESKDPELRSVLSQALQRLADLRNAPARAVIEELRAALEASQKPLRDAARVRPGTGRGKRSRPLR
jgi:hypothetical protein